MVLIRAQPASGRTLQWRPMAGVLSTEEEGEEEEKVGWRLVGVFIAAPLQPLFFFLFFFLEVVVVWIGGVELTAAVIPQKQEGEF